MDVMYEGLKDTNAGWAAVKPFVQAQKIAYPILMDDGQAERAFNVESMPATWLIDKAGRVAAIYQGVVNRNDTEANIKRLLGER